VSSGVSGAGLTTIVQPARSAGISLDMIVNCGTFHGGIAATTPTGSWRTMTSPSEPARVSSHGKARAMVRNASICIHGAGAWARLEKDSGAPISVEMISAISPSLPAYRWEKVWTTSMRSSGLIRGHGPESKARRAAATAASMSALLPSGTVATTCSECGETTWIVSPVAGAAQSPSMKKVLRSRLIAISWVRCCAVGTGGRSAVVTGRG
jgi:hypothetical protein